MKATAVKTVARAKSDACIDFKPDGDGDQQFGPAAALEVRHRQSGRDHATGRMDGRAHVRVVKIVSVGEGAANQRGRRGWHRYVHAEWTTLWCPAHLACHVDDNLREIFVARCQA